MFENIKYVYIIDLKGKIMSLNSTGNEYNYKNLSDILSNISKDKINAGLEKIERGENICFSIVNLDMPDKSKEFDCEISPLYNNSEQINHAVVIVTSKKYEFLFNESNDAIFITDFKGNYLEVNSAATGRSGISSDKFKRLSLFNIPNKRGSEIIKEYFLQIIENGSATKQIDYTNANEEIISTEIKGKKIAYNGKKAILHSSREISQQKKTNQEILETIIHSEEKERTYFASEILDNLGPLLSLNKMLIETYFDSGQTEVKNKIVQKIKTNLEDAIKITTELTQNISPHVLTKFGLRPALFAFISKIEKEQNVRFSLSLNIPEKFSEKIDVVLYRAIIELINYFIKYKCSAYINIDITYKNHFFKSVIESNNSLINTDIRPDSNFQLELLNVESRLNSINAEIAYNKSKGIDSIIIECPGI